MSMSIGEFTAIVDTLVYLIAPFLPLIPVLVYRKRLIAYIAAQIGPYIVTAVLGWAFVTKEQKGEDGTVVQIKALSEPARGLLAASVPLLIAEVVKNVKLKLPTGGGALPAGIDLSNLSESLPAILNMVPGANLNIGGFKVPKPIIALLAPLLQGLGKGGAGKVPGRSGSNAAAEQILQEALKP